MAGKGGYQKPTKPATYSNPGAGSQRTDGGVASKQAIRYMSGGSYGDATEMMDIQRSAPMEAAPDMPAVVNPTGDLTARGSRVIPIDAETQFPNEPVTSGVPIGAGPGIEALNLPGVNQNNGMANALVLLNQLGDNASPQVKALRAAIAAQLNNESGVH